MPLVQKLLWPLKKIKLGLILFYAFAINSFIRVQKKYVPSDSPEVNEIIERSWIRTDFSDHLLTLFSEGLSLHPNMIVELGTRGGESTFVLERVAGLCHSTFISVDIDDCSGSSKYPGWIFVRSDDIAFAKRFPAWCSERKLQPEIDLLFIDTSHLYEHTIEEIRHWFPFLSKRAKAIFHDTNLKYVFSRKDGSVGISGWDNHRGVIRALEDYLGGKYAEDVDTMDFRKGWLVRHWVNCGGFTVLERF